MRYNGPKNKTARREGADLGLKTPGTKAHASLLKRINILPGQHGIKKKRKMSERGKQLREKQKLRALFGLSEKQLKNYFKKAKKMKGNTAVLLCNLIEKRLDNIVYRLGFAPTRASARQLVSHRHIKVNDRVVNVASYQVSTKEKVGFAREKSQKIPYIEISISNKSFMMPAWLERKDTSGGIISEPESEDVEKQIDLRSVIEFYSR